MAHIHSPKTGVCCLRYVTGRGSDTFLPSPLYRERRSLYETHHSVVGHHGPNLVGGKRGRTGGGGRLRRSAKLGRWAWRVHPEGRKRCPSWRHDRGQGSSPRGRIHRQERDKAARGRRRDRSPPRAKADSPCSKANGPTAICVLGDFNPETGEVNKRVSDVSVSGFTFRGFKDKDAFMIDVYAARNA